MIYVTTGRKINSKMLPADAGCIVDNVQTVLAIYDAVCKTTPSMSRVVTLTGDAMAEPQNYKVKFGMSHAELLEEAGGLKENAKKTDFRRLMMGMAMYDLNTPITKTSSSILAMSEDEVEKFEPTNCIRCSRCATVCPSHLVPQMMAQAAERNDLDYFQKLNGMECYECGTCTFVCPAKRRLTQIFKQARRAVMDQNRKKISMFSYENMLQKQQNGGNNGRELWNVSSSPHVRDHSSTQSIMRDVVIAFIAGYHHWYL